MCGITGFLSRDCEFGGERAEHVVRGMALTLQHRGPDDDGVWVDEDAGVALGFRRLAILDTSARGHQPMVSANGRYVIVFNGEIYNFRELRGRLEGLGHKFTTGTDTEVILASAVEWGANEVPIRLQGMFAYALWDRKDRVLHLARDRVGIKPLYYGWNGSTFLFGSELQALGRHPDFAGQISHQALSLYLDFGYVPAPLSIYEGIHKLPPGTVLQVRAGMSLAEPQRYWDFTSVFVGARPSRSDDNAIEELEDKLVSAVDRHMVADVPLGALLSGGIDSSTLVAMMCAKAKGRVKTFSIGFAEKGFDESPYARKVAAHLETDHTDIILTQQDALSLIPRVSEIYDEPFADSSQIPTFLVSQLARTQVTVALSGDGGDELFGGYNRYRFVPAAIRYRNLFGNHISSGAGALLRRAGAWLSYTMPSHRVGEGFAKFGSLMSSGSIEAAYSTVCQHFSGSALATQGASRGDWSAHQGVPGLEAVAQMQLWDGLTYLPGDILTKVDRASMALGLEARVPFLDNDLIEFAGSLPLKMKIRGKHTKWLLRQVLYRHVPRELVERPKAGFAIPLAGWLRGPLTEWAESLLDVKALQKQDLLRSDAVHSEWLEFRAGRRPNHHRLWAVLMFQAWFMQQRRHRAENTMDVNPEQYRQLARI